MQKFKRDSYGIDSTTTLAILVPSIP